ncbi:hypothetical protein FA10DRAFT_16310 [Acaromyces ingoldii]|uniref:Uncharacterized protein n=1 Tax=Acaromyces ingoldii TaxID=215250 RepID=A0A316YYS3_9BASI|nr:hypothetical protein FA10DRAFT_16310 [Acaromyces ingoldii]PWN93213.1 hypothetical protein FA10DRAFT_16310 [Acaromyces ingoldii]
MHQQRIIYRILHTTDDEQGTGSRSKFHLTLLRTPVDSISSGFENDNDFHPGQRCVEQSTSHLELRKCVFASEMSNFAHPKVLQAMQRKVEHTISKADLPNADELMQVGSPCIETKSSKGSSIVLEIGAPTKLSSKNVNAVLHSTSDVSLGFM